MRPDQTDRQGQTHRQEDAAATVDLGLGFLPIRSCKESDIIPVLIEQQEGGGRWRPTECMADSLWTQEEA